MTRHTIAMMAALLLAGCSGTGQVAGDELDAGDASTEAMPPLPDPIHDERQVVASAWGWTAQLPCGEVRQCADHPFSLPRTADIRATLAWNVPGNMAVIRIYQDDVHLAWAGVDFTDRPTTATTLDVTLPAGDYILRVDPIQMAGDRYVLDAAFAEHVSPAGAAAAPPVFGPHVVIGVADTGINPYHELFYRPQLTEHPCTYIRGLSCEMEALPLSIGMDDWTAAVEADRHLWESIEVGKWYWIPQTPFVAVTCGAYAVGSLPTQSGEDLCILDDFNAHGAMVTSILAMQNPEAYIAFQAGGGIESFGDAGIPVDLYSVSLGSYVPRPVPGTCGDPVPLYFQPAGNLVWPPHLHCYNSRPDKIIVGGGYTDPYGIDAQSGHAPEVTSYFCPPYAPHNRVVGLEPAGKWCGTSFATPTIAGAVSKAILEVRRASGYDGATTPEGVVDAILGVTAADVRQAINRTATYAPRPDHGIGSNTQVPLNAAAPWLQWGWGWYDADNVDATVAHLLGTGVATQKPAQVVTYMEAQYEMRRTMYG